MILITNDDGIVAPGIKALVEVASKFGEVLVVAPDSPQSGQGHAITLNQPLKLRKVNLFSGIDAYECSGTPVDCVKLAKNVLLKNKKIDLCLSGINHGANSSINIIYSGTMSAAMEASIEKIDSIGFSLLNYSFDADFEPAKFYIEKIIQSVLANPLKSCKLLNVNIPACSQQEIKGIKVCRQGDGTWVEEFQEGTDPRGEKYYWLTGKFVSYESPEDTENDIWALKNNFISVVPSGHDLTHYTELNNFKYMENL
ncbi:MAG: 5'/3'-nucleotidase SurE [Saprospiraceae bacterium]|nr:5'/3'-nucleotidase SurE [Saprospiraceae bacterium]MBK8669155.1 5'/3'-nucleotidase SurE [Saprospiraceae bacterium]